eukprot:SAG31_NODE_46042_length_256_cov_0.656051_1_plen_65_part_01
MHKMSLWGPLTRVENTWRGQDQGDKRTQEPVTLTAADFAAFAPFSAFFMVAFRQGSRRLICFDRH